MKLMFIALALIATLGSGPATAAWQVSPGLPGSKSNRPSKMVHSSDIEGDNRASLMVMCVLQRTSVVISFPYSTLSVPYGDYVQVSYRIDDQRAMTARFEGAWEALLLQHGSGFAKALIGATKIRIETSEVAGTVYKAEFEIAGAEEALKPVRDACRW